MVGDQLTVLVTDDDRGVRRLFAEWLSEDNEVVTAADGEAALSALSPAVDVVFLDREMPGLSGSEVAREIAAADVDPHVVVVSSRRVDADIVDAPIDGYVRKPASESDLRRVLQEYRTRDEYQASLDELFALTAKLAAIEADVPREQLADDERVRRLRWLVAEKRAEVDHALARTRADWSTVFRTCGDHASRPAQKQF